MSTKQCVSVVAYVAEYRFFFICKVGMIINLCVQRVAKLMRSELLDNSGWGNVLLVVSCGHSWVSLYSLKIHQSWASWI